MKRNKLQLFSICLYITFIISTFITMFIVYKNIVNKISISFVLGYLGLTLFIILYGLITIISKTVKSPWTKIRKELIRCMLLFISLILFGCIIDLLFKHSLTNLPNHIPIALGVTLGELFRFLVFDKGNS